MLFRSVSKTLLIAATFALIVAIPTSISRTLFFQAIISLFFFLWAKSSQSGIVKSIFQLTTGLMLLLILFLNVSVLNNQIDAFSDRFTKANENEGGLNSVFVDRFFGGMVSGIINIDDKNAIFGQGIGMGTNVGAQLLAGKNRFLIAEGEWGRIIGESGIVFGFLIILVRINMTGVVGFKSFKSLKRGDALPWMLLSYGLLSVLQAQWSQPNSLGFYVLIGGLILASLEKNPVTIKN